MAHPLEATIREAYAAFGRGDLDGYLKHCTDDFTFNVPGNGGISGIYVGKQGLYELAGKAMTANQIEFLNLIINHLTEHGVMDPALLYESPFTDLTPQGPDGLFDSVQVDLLVATLEHVTAMAAAA